MDGHRWPAIGIGPRSAAPDSAVPCVRQPHCQRPRKWHTLVSPCHQGIHSAPSGFHGRRQSTVCHAAGQKSDGRYGSHIHRRGERSSSSGKQFPGCADSTERDRYAEHSSSPLQQQNTSDCGAFLLAFAEAICNLESESWSAEDLVLSATEMGVDVGRSTREKWKAIISDMIT